jgi:hypothetical protein
MRENEPGKNVIRTKWDMGTNSWSRLRPATGCGGVFLGTGGGGRKEWGRKKQAQSYI